MPRGGKRPGSGRKKGYKAPHTLEAHKAKEEFVAQVKKNLRPLINSQMSLALGTQYLMKMDSDTKNIKIVKDIGEIEDFLMNQKDGTRTKYYYISSKGKKKKRRRS
jgi:hypothetical protein